MNLDISPELYEQLSKPSPTSSSGGVDRALSDTYMGPTGTKRVARAPGWAPVLIKGGSGATTGAGDRRWIGTEEGEEATQTMASPARWLSLEMVVIGFAAIIVALIGMIWLDIRDDITNIRASAQATSEGLSDLTTRVESGFAQIIGRLDVTNTKLDNLATQRP